MIMNELSNPKYTNIIQTKIERPRLGGFLFGEVVDFIKNTKNKHSKIVYEFTDHGLARYLLLSRVCLLKTKVPKLSHCLRVLPKSEYLRNPLGRLSDSHPDKTALLQNIQQAEASI